MITIGVCDNVEDWADVGGEEATYTKNGAVNTAPEFFV